MFVALASNGAEPYRGFDRDCPLYVNAKIGLGGRVDAETDAGWMDYIDLLDAVPIPYSNRALSVMNRIIGLCGPNRIDLPIL